MLQIEDIRIMLKSFAERQIEFYNEYDFQDAIEKYLAGNTDYHVAREDEANIDNDKANIDFVLSDSASKIPIEVKYKLFQTSPLPNAVYSFFKDVYRIEYLVANDTLMNKGFCIFLSNEPRFWKQRNVNPTADAREFIMPDKSVLHGVKVWYSKNNNPNIARNYPPIHISGEYSITWEDYGHILLSGQRDTLFKYVIIEVCKGNKQGQEIINKQLILPQIECFEKRLIGLPRDLWISLEFQANKRGMSLEDYIKKVLEHTS